LTSRGTDHDRTRRQHGVGALGRPASSPQKVADARGRAKRCTTKARAVGCHRVVLGPAMVARNHHQSRL